MEGGEEIMTTAKAKLFKDATFKCTLCKEKMICRRVLRYSLPTTVIHVYSHVHESDCDLIEIKIEVKKESRHV